MRNSFILYMVILSFCMTTCTKNGGDTPGPPPPPAEKPLPAWNPSQTSVLYFFTTLKDQALGTTVDVYNSISHVLADTASYRLVMLDRSDVNTTAALNGVSIVARATNMFPMFGLHKYKGETAEGTGILVKETIGQQKDYEIATDCRLKTFQTFSKPDMEWPLATVRFDNETQLAAATQQLSMAISQNRVMVGTIQAHLFTKLRTQIGTYSSSYRVEKASQNNEGYTIFYASPKYWVLREAVAIPVGTSVQAYKLSIEGNVFY